MTTINDIYFGAERLINEIIRKESTDQGHYLTGAMEDSFDSTQTTKGKAAVMEGFAVYYTKFVNEGLPPESASFKQFPFLVEYFKKRGLGGQDDRDAKAAAAATIKKWMKEGMPTQSSKRFSKTGSRTNMIENAIIGNENKIDDYMTDSFDFLVDELYSQEKSETV